MLDKLKKRWGVNSNFQILKIFVVFGITGTTSSLIPIPDIFGITTDNYNIIIYWLIRIVLLTITYQFILVFVAFLFGEFKFFWNFVRKFLSFLRIRF